MFLKCFLKFLKLVIETNIDDNLVQPGGLSNYHVPPVFTLDQTSSAPGDQELDDVSPQIVGDEPIKMIERDGLEEEMSVELDDDGSTDCPLQTS